MNAIFSHMNVHPKHTLFSYQHLFEVEKSGNIFIIIDFWRAREDAR